MGPTVAARPACWIPSFAVPKPQSVATRGTPTVRSMAVDLTQLTQTEQAVADTLRGWGAGLDNEQKFWWADWTNMIRDTITAMRTGDPVMYEDDK